MRLILLGLLFATFPCFNASAAIVTIVDTIDLTPKSDFTLANRSGSSFTTGFVGSGAYLESIEILGGTTGALGPFGLELFDGNSAFPLGPLIAKSTTGTLTSAAAQTFTFGSGAGLTDNSVYTFLFRNETFNNYESASVQVVSGDPYPGGNPFSGGVAVLDSDIAMRINIFSPAAIPEPTSFGLLALGAVGFVVRRRRARRIAKAVA